MVSTPSTAPEPLKLHLGCFDQVVPGWMNTDITPHIFVARVPGLAFLLRRLGKMTEDRYRQHREGLFRRVRYLDIRKRFPLEDESVEAVYTQHMLEHLYPDTAVRCLKESHRVLKPGGTLRISIPDLDRMVRDYDPERPEVFLDAVFEAREAKEKNRHHWHYNECSLRKLLESLRFRDILRCDYRQGRCPDLPLLENRPDSLFMEAVK